MATLSGLAEATSAPSYREQLPASWVKWAALLGLAVPHLVTGVWAIVTPSGWFDTFPGIGPALVAAEPPFNTHLTTDSGAGFFATGIALLLAFLQPRRDLLTMALSTYLAFGVPHALYHSFNPAPGLSASEDVTNSMSLWAGVLLAVVCLWGARNSAAE